MSRRRDHHPRDDGTVCPSPEGCARLYHGSITSGLNPGETCECCGQEVTDSSRYIARQHNGTWGVYDTAKSCWPTIVQGRSITHAGTQEVAEIDADRLNKEAT